MSAAPIGGAAAQQLAQQELARPEYHTGSSWLTRLVNAIGRFVSQLVSGGGSSTALAVVGALVIVLVGLAVVRAGRAPSRSRRQPADDPLRPEPGVDHAQRARALRAQRQHREAMREWLRATVATLEARQILSPRPGRTSAQAAELGGAALPEAREPLAAAASRFDQVWFGNRPANDDDVELAERAATAVVTGAPAGRVRR